MSSSDWCTIESDPGLFTELLENLGVKGVELEELWTLDDESLSQLAPLYGLIFLFKWTPNGQEDLHGSQNQRQPLKEDTPEGLFFAHQVTTNACATQAILSVVLNTPNLDLGPIMTEFLSFTSSFPPSLKGEAIGSSSEIQNAHNSFARKDSFLHERQGPTPATGEDDVFHFVAYIPFNGKVYELDGLQNEPLLIGQPSTSEPWHSLARDAIRRRMDSSPEIKFNLMAVVGDRRILLEDQLKLTNDSALQAELALQHAKRAKWKLENQRRRHNYVPLCVSVLKELARLGRLPEFIQDASTRIQAKKSKS
jgi:ubiquitin carboxyl-terminal hydrolase L5